MSKGSNFDPLVVNGSTLVVFIQTGQITEGEICELVESRSKPILKSIKPLKSLFIKLFLILY